MGGRWDVSEALALGKLSRTGRALAALSPSGGLAQAHVRGLEALSEGVLASVLRTWRGLASDFGGRLVWPWCGGSRP